MTGFNYVNRKGLTAKFGVLDKWSLMGGGRLREAVVTLRGSTRQEKTILYLGSYTSWYIDCFPNNLKLQSSILSFYYTIHNKLLQIAIVTCTQTHTVKFRQ